MLSSILTYKYGLLSSAKFIFAFETFLNLNGKSFGLGSCFLAKTALLTLRRSSLNLYKRRSLSFLDRYGVLHNHSLVTKPRLFRIGNKKSAQQADRNHGNSVVQSIS